GGLPPPRPVGAPPFGAGGQRVIDLDRRMRVQRVVRARPEQEHADRESRIEDERGRAVRGPGPDRGAGGGAGRRRGAAAPGGRGGGVGSGARDRHGRSVASAATSAGGIPAAAWRLASQNRHTPSRSGGPAGSRAARPGSIAPRSRVKWRRLSGTSPSAVAAAA